MHLLEAVDDFFTSVQALDDVGEGALHVAELFSQLLFLLKHSAQLGLRQLILLLVLSWTFTLTDVWLSRFLNKTRTK